MEELINKIDNYLNVQEEKECIDRSLLISSDIKEVIELIKSSDKPNEILKLLDRKVRIEVEKFIEGGLLWKK